MSKSLLLATVLVLLSTSRALAVSDESITRRRPDRPQDAQIQEIRQESQAKREEIKSRLEEMRSNVAENHARRLERRFAFYYSRLSNIITRFDKRLEILKAGGQDVTSVSAKLTAVKSKLESAKAKGAEAVAAFKAIDPAKFSEQKTEAMAARDLANSARKLFMETHSLLKDALKSLKALSKPALPAASAAVEQAQ